MHDTIVWLNGAFGVGKTTTSQELVRLLPGARIFDPEIVGRMLRTIVTEPSTTFRTGPPGARSLRRPRWRSSSTTSAR